MWDGSTEEKQIAGELRTARAGRVATRLFAGDYADDGPFQLLLLDVVGEAIDLV